MTAPIRPDRDPIVVVGDALLDVDLTGTATRLCPGEPVPVLEGLRETARPGGAGLAAALVAQQRPVLLVTALGRDGSAERLRAALPEDVEVLDLGRTATVTKTRVRTGDRTVVRFDSAAGPDPDVAPSALPVLRTRLARAAAILVSDYGLGLLAAPAVRAALGEVVRELPGVWDPHPRGAEPIPGLTLVTPNEAEAAGLSGLPGAERSELAEQLRVLVQRWDAGHVAITRGRAGAVLGDATGGMLVLPPSQSVTGDTCGAGDAFAAAAVAALADGASAADAVAGAVERAASFVADGAAGAFADRLRPAPRDPNPGRTAGTLGLVDAARARGRRVVLAGGCFDLLHAGHVAYLEAARELGDLLVVAVNGDDSVRALKGAGRPIVPAEDRARVVASLRCVDAVEVFEESTPEAVIRRLRPDVFAKGGDYDEANLPEAPLVRALGGTVAILPLLGGRSSTRLVDAARHSHPVSWKEQSCLTTPAASAAS